MKKSIFLGSTVGLLLLFSIISYSQALGQQQDPKVNQQANQTPGQTVATSATESAAGKSSASTESAERLREMAANAPADASASTDFEATAYSLHGRTASGAAPTAGIIAADPRVLPIGSRVRIEAGNYSGEYVVADTGGAVRGKRIDIWTPSSREAMRFGRRKVKLTVLHLAGKRGPASSRARTVNPK
ncbi:MAG TPA: 3D domain-containing protein [Pyrinomonadaceae bacterium]|nr:3D domain-containing protein [Pyrinomonadaceae bacterium]